MLGREGEEGAKVGDSGTGQSRKGMRHPLK